jgi:hypothetical protein
MKSGASGKTTHSRVSAKEQLREIELKRALKILSQSMLNYIKNNPN